ncbi:urease accessory protein UreF [Nocardioides ultimimeridianus]
MHQDLLLMLLADARLPVAGHTQSNVLEPAVHDGLTGVDVLAFARSRLASVTLVDASTAVVARHACGRDGAAAELEGVESAWAARTASSAVRAASRAQGRALLRLAGRLWPDAGPLLALGNLAAPCRPVVLGAVASAVGLSPAALARLIGYDDVQTVCAAALKLLPLDPAAVAGWVHSALPDIDALASAVADHRHPSDIPARAHPQIEAWAQAHALRSRRLFSA